MSKPTNQLAERIAALEIDATAAEVAAVIRRDEREVADWLDGKSDPDPDALVLLRVFDAPHTGRLAVERLRRTFKKNMRGVAMERAGIDTVPGYGGFTGTTAGRPV